MLGDFLATCDHVCMLGSQKGVSLNSIRVTRVYGCVGVGQPSSTVVMGIDEVREEDISFPDHISGPPRGWRSAVGEEGGNVACDNGWAERSPFSVGLQGEF